MTNKIFIVAHIVGVLLNVAAGWVAPVVELGTDQVFTASNRDCVIATERSFLLVAESIAALPQH
jgi:hypothetical protein